MKKLFISSLLAIGLVSCGQSKQAAEKVPTKTPEAETLLKNLKIRVIKRVIFLPVLLLCFDILISKIILRREVSVKGSELIYIRHTRI